jgi:uncharacterized protein with beta-barrel porin domain
MVSDGDLTGITALRNNSTAAVGISVAATRTLSANIINNASGATINDAGTLTALTSFTSAGTVTGAGTIIGSPTFVSGGTFAPGNGTAGMTVMGDLALQSGAFYLAQLGTTALLANVTGAATLNGTVQYVVGGTITRTYDILHAAGRLSGTFSGVQPVNSNFSTTLSYTTTDVFLNLNAQLAAGMPLNRNQQSVANGIDTFFNSGGPLPASFSSLFAMTGSNLGNALTQVSGQGATGSQQTTFNAMNQFMGVMSDPFIAGRADPVSTGGRPNAYAEESLAYDASGKGHSAKERNAYATMYAKAPVAPAFEPRWSVWTAGFGGSQTTAGNASVGSNDSSSSVYGTAVGADYRFSPDTLAGFALAGGGTSFNVNGLGYGRSDLFQAGAFVRHNIGAAYITGALAYGWQDITTNRTLTLAGFDQLRAEFNANTFSGRVEGGYRFVSPWMNVGITPYAATQFTTFDLPAYAEQAIAGTNNFALAYGAKSVTDPRSELGFRTDKSYAMQDGVLTLRGRLAWAHDYDPDRAIGATFQSLPGASFVVNGAAQASDSVLTTASIERKWISNWSVAATFEGEFSNVTSSYAGKGVVRYAW